MHKITIKLLFFLLSSLLVSSCTKEIPKELLEKPNSEGKQQSQQQNKQQQQMPDDSIHRNISQNNSGDVKGSDENTQNDIKGDPKAEQMVKEADNADTQYQKTKSDADKIVCVNKQLSAANYLMFEATLSPKKKYRPALQRYNRVLELDPKNEEAMANKKQIEDIYQSMGMPVPN